MGVLKPTHHSRFRDSFFINRQRHITMENHEFKFIDLRIDWAFKYVYGSRGNEDLLLNLIDAILPEKHISKVELRGQEQIPDSRKQRRSVFDVNCIHKFHNLVSPLTVRIFKSLKS